MRAYKEAREMAAELSGLHKLNWSSFEIIDGVWSEHTSTITTTSQSSDSVGCLTGRTVHSASTKVVGKEKIYTPLPQNIQDELARRGH